MRNTLWFVCGLAICFTCACNPNDVVCSLELQDGVTLQVIGHMGIDDGSAGIYVQVLSRTADEALTSYVVDYIDSTEYPELLKQGDPLYGFYQDASAGVVGVYSIGDPSIVLVVVDIPCKVIAPSSGVQGEKATCIEKAVDRIRRSVGEVDLVFDFYDN